MDDTTTTKGRLAALREKLLTHAESAFGSNASPNAALGNIASPREALEIVARLTEPEGLDMTMAPIFPGWPDSALTAKDAERLDRVTKEVARLLAVTEATVRATDDMRSDIAWLRAKAVIFSGEDPMKVRVEREAAREGNDPNAIPPEATKGGETLASLVSLVDTAAAADDLTYIRVKDADGNPIITLFKNADGAWRQDENWTPPKDQADQFKLDAYEKALREIAATRYGVIARRVLGLDAKPAKVTPPDPAAPAPADPHANKDRALVGIQGLPGMEAGQSLPGWYFQPDAIFLDPASIGGGIQVNIAAPDGESLDGHVRVFGQQKLSVQGQNGIFLLVAKNVERFLTDGMRANLVAAVAGCSQEGTMKKMAVPEGWSAPSAEIVAPAASAPSDTSSFVLETSLYGGVSSSTS